VSANIIIEERGKLMTIKEARIEVGFTQKQVQDLIGIPIRTLQNWEAGVRKCPDYIERLVVEKILELGKK
jgi:DNA-binding transcriptional regulator YiaG